MLRNRIIFGILFIVSLCFVYQLGGVVPYTFFYLMICFPIFSFLYAFIVYKSLSCHQNISSITATKGDTIKFSYVFMNHSFLMNPFVACEFCDTTSLIGELGGFAEFSINSLSHFTKDYSIKCKYRGIYRIGIKRVYIEDFLRIFQFNAKIEESFILKVYPKIIGIDNFELMSHIMEESDLSMNLISEQMNDISEIREYRIGDSLRKIHWKLTAKLDEIMVKNTESTSKNTTEFLLDLSPNGLRGETSLAAEDKLIEILCSFSYHFAKKKYPVRVQTYIERLDAIEFDDINGFRKLYNFTTDTNFNSSIKSDELLELFLRSNTMGSNLFIFTQNINKEFIVKVIKAGNYGWKVYLIVLNLSENSFNLDNNILNMLRKNDIEVLQFNIDTSIKEIIDRYKQVI